MSFYLINLRNNLQKSYEQTNEADFALENGILISIRMGSTFNTMRRGCEEDKMPRKFYHFKNRGKSGFSSDWGNIYGSILGDK